MAWLLRDGEVLASLELATTMASRRRGLLGRSGFEGALLLKPARSVHTIGMRFPIDVAFLDRDMVVLRAVTLPRFRMTRWYPRARSVVEAEAGAFAMWNLVPGDQLEIKD
jgi:uncharacterized membrane protein (UPF0127 family)